MTTKLEETFNLPDIKEATKIQNALKKLNQTDQEESNQISLTDITDAVEDLNDMKRALVKVPDIENYAEQLDSIAKVAMDNVEDVIELGLGMEDRYAHEYIKAANDLMRTAIDAKKINIDSKLKMIDLQIKQNKLEWDKLKGGQTGEAKEVDCFDRNEFLRNK